MKVSGSQVEGGSVGGHVEGSGVTMTVVVSTVTGQYVSTGGGVETTVVVVVDTATGQEVEGTGGQEASTVTVSVLKRVETGQVVSGGGGHEDGGGVTVVVTGQGEGEAVIVVGATDGHVGLSRGCGMTALALPLSIVIFVSESTPEQSSRLAEKKTCSVILSVITGMRATPLLRPSAMGTLNFPPW